MIPMNVLNSEGQYEFVDGTKKLKKSSHPAYAARIELALPQGTWCYAPAAGHDLERYKTVRQTTAKLQEFQKDLAFYLAKYGPEFTELLVKRGAISVDLEIQESALDV